MLWFVWFAVSACGRIGFSPADDARGDDATGGDFVASNGVPTDVTIAGGIAITFDGSVNSTTGAMTGTVNRAPGEGAAEGVHFARVDSPTGPLGVFTVERLVLGSVTVVGTNPIVFVAREIEVTGTVSVSAAPASRQPGPGGDPGASMLDTLPATSCRGSNGVHVANASVPDGGGGGGGGGAAGAIGGAGGVADGGAGGASCLTTTLVPLRGGGGGGLGSAVDPVPPCEGGGGGGALQLSATVQLTLRAGARLLAAGSGGGRGEASIPIDSGGGCGGGAGGGILAESLALVVEPGASIFANGGAGGGGGFDIDAAPGADGQASQTPATGGAGSTAGNGGAGGAGGAVALPGPGAVGVYNGGGGGGAAGQIVLRSVMQSGAPTASPTPVVLLVP